MTTPGWRESSEAFGTLRQLLLDIAPTTVVISSKSLAYLGAAATDLFEGEAKGMECPKDRLTNGDTTEDPFPPFIVNTNVLRRFPSHTTLSICVCRPWAATSVH